MQGAIVKERIDGYPEKFKKIKPYGKYWEKLANELARSYSRIYACRDCGYPVHESYCCTNCGSREP